MPIASELRLYFSYSQVLIYDTLVSLPGLAWTDAHYRQGFARQASVLALATLEEFGHANVRVFTDESPGPAAVFDRLLLVPFHCQSGSVAIEGPEEGPLLHSIPLQPGHFGLWAGQRRRAEEELYIDLFFSVVAEPLTASSILKRDDQLSPAHELLESAETAVP